VNIFVPVFFVLRFEYNLKKVARVSRGVFSRSPDKLKLEAFTRVLRECRMPINPVEIQDSCCHSDSKYLAIITDTLHMPYHYFFENLHQVEEFNTHLIAETFSNQMSDCINIVNRDAGGKKLRNWIQSGL
jgi:hypothetical protein